MIYRLKKWVSSEGSADVPTRVAWQHASSWRTAKPMDDLRSLDLGEVILRAAAALSQASGRPIKIDQVQPLSRPDRRNLIVRCVAVDEDGKARPVIVKATRSRDYDPTADNSLQASGLVREWVATALVSAHAAADEYGAALLAGEVETALAERSSS